jgi:ankyrin repeat protein
VNLLPKKGADPNARCNNKRIALNAAANLGSEPMVKLLLDNKVDPNIIDDHEWTALSQAATICGYEAIGKLQLEKGAELGADARGKAASRERGRTRACIRAGGGSTATRSIQWALMHW